MVIALVDYCDKYPHLLKKNIIFLIKLLDMIIMLMLSNPGQIDEEWLSPYEGFDEENED